MAKVAIKREILEGPLGAVLLGVTPISEFGNETKLQDTLEVIRDLLLARVRAVRDEGGAPLTARPYLNIISPTASASDNAGLQSTDIKIPDEVHRGTSAPATPHSYKLWINTSFTPAVTYEWNGSAWTRIKGQMQWRGDWAASTAYEADDVVEYQGSSFVALTAHTSSGGSPPTDDGPTWDLVAQKGEPGPGPGGVHGSTHSGNSTDPVPNATTTEAGLLSSADKTKLNGLSSDHGALTGLGDDDHTIYALANGTRLVLATSVSTPATNQIRLNAGALEYYNGTSWVSMLTTPLDSSVTNAKVSSSAAIVKSKLAPLAIDNADLAADHSLVRHVTSTTRPTSALEGQMIYETDTDLILKNTSATATPAWTNIAPVPVTYAPAWTQQSGAGALFAAYGDGNPQIVNFMSSDDAPRPFPSEIWGIARTVGFSLPKTLNVSAAKLFTLAAVSGVVRLGIYDLVTNAKVWDSNAVTTVANDWTTVPVTGVTLIGNRQYWYAITATANYGGTVWGSPHSPRAAPANQWGAGPIGGKPQLGVPAYLGMAVTTSTLPASITGATFAVPSWAGTGTLPLLFLEGTAS